MKKLLIFILILCFPTFAFSQNVGFIDVGDELDEFVANSLKEWNEKGEFESSIDYNLRMKSSESKKIFFRKKFFNKKIKNISEISSENLKLGKYNADKQHFPITIEYNNYTFKINFKVNIKDAERFKKSWDRLKNREKLENRFYYCEEDDNLNGWDVKSLFDDWNKFYFKLLPAYSNRKIYISELIFFNRKLKISSEVGKMEYNVYSGKKEFIPNNKAVLSIHLRFKTDDAVEDVGLELFTYFDDKIFENVSVDNEVDKFISSFLSKYKIQLGLYFILLEYFFNRK